MGQQIWVRQNSALKTKFIDAFHSTPMGGHSGVQATYLRIKKHFQWRGIKIGVDNFVKQCAICQHDKADRLHPVGLLQPLPIPEGVWQDISMDFIEGLPKFEGFNSILVVVDRLFKYAHFISLRHPFITQQVAQMVLDVIVRLHDMPKSIVSDRDRIFTSEFWKELFKLSKTTLLISTTYHPQIEHVN
jgi:hypothetical protein